MECISFETQSTVRASIRGPEVLNKGAHCEGLLWYLQIHDTHMLCGREAHAFSSGVSWMCSLLLFFCEKAWMECFRLLRKCGLLIVWICGITGKEGRSLVLLCFIFTWDFRQRLHERVRLSWELNGLIAMHSQQWILFSHDSWGILAFVQSTFISRGSWMHAVTWNWQPNICGSSRLLPRQVARPFVWIVGRAWKWPFCCFWFFIQDMANFFKEKKNCPTNAVKYTWESILFLKGWNLLICKQTLKIYSIRLVLILKL